jgi:hypothetical protein
MSVDRVGEPCSIAAVSRVFPCRTDGTGHGLSSEQLLVESLNERARGTIANRPQATYKGGSTLTNERFSKPANARQLISQPSGLASVKYYDWASHGVIRDQEVLPDRDRS